MPKDKKSKEIKMTMNNPKLYHGYLALPRHAKLLQQELGYSLFSLYIALVMDARWYRGNPYFCSVVGTQIEVAVRLGISQSKLSRGLEKLHTKSDKFVIKHTRYIRLGYLPLFLTDVAGKMDESYYANLNELYADMHRINAELQGNYVKLQEERAQNTPQRLYSSSKDNLDSSNTEVLDIDEISREIGGEDLK